MIQKLFRILFFFIISINVVEAESRKIVAIVNNEPITWYEFQARKKMIVALNNVKNSDNDSSIDRQISQTALNSLIDDELMRQHAIKVGAKISDSELNDAILSIEERNEMPKGHLINFFKSKGVDINSFKSQIKSELIKSNILSYMSKSVTISPKEIDYLILSNNVKNVKLSLKVFTSKDKSEKTINKMQTLQKNLKRSNSIKDSMYKDFADLAVIEGNLSSLDNQLQTIIKDLDKGSVSSIFESSEGFKLVLVCSKIVDHMSDEENSYVINFLTNKKMSQQAKKFFSDMRKRAYIQIMLAI